MSDFKQLMEISRGFWRSSVLFAGVKLGIFDSIEGEGKRLKEIINELHVDQRGAEILLNALAALGIVEKRKDVYRNTDLSSKYLVSSSADYRGNIFMHSSDMWKAWGELESVVRTGKPFDRYEEKFLQNNERRVENFIRGMDQMAGELAELLADSDIVRKATRMLDAGGGPGTYCRHFVRKNPGLKATILDLPLTLKVAEEIIREHGLEGKISTIEGDMLEADFGAGYDLVLLSQILHSFSPDQNRKIIGKAFRSLLPGGAVMINEFALDEKKTSPLDAALFAVNMLVNTEGGSAYTVNEIKSWLRDAGFEDISVRVLIERATNFIAVRRE